MKRTSKKIITLIMALVLVVSLLPAVALPAAASNINSDQTLSGTITEVVNITGSADAANPVVVTINGTVTLNVNIHIKSGYVKIVGGESGGTLLRGTTMTHTAVTPSATQSSLIIVEDGTLTLQDVIVDGNKANVTANSPLVTLSAYGDNTKHPKLVLNSGAILQNNYNFNTNTDEITSFDNTKSGTSWLMAAGVGVLSNYSTITINDGARIRWNTSVGYGGAMGELFSSSAAGGTHTINMTGGEIYGNLSGARRSGATSAVHISSDGTTLTSTFNMSGGKIYGNMGTCVSTTTTKTGAGVANDVKATAVLNFSGSAKVTGNYWKNGINDSEKGISTGSYDSNSYVGAVACNVLVNATSYPNINSFTGQLGITNLTGNGVRFATLTGGTAPELTAFVNDDHSSYYYVLQNVTELHWFAPAPTVSLGEATLTDGKYYYENAAVSGTGIRTILISFSDNVTSGDAITLPTVSGFAVSGTSNVYTKRINIDTGITGTDNASAVQAYVRGVGFSIASATQTVSVTVTTESITTDTFYNSATQHYYQYIPGGITWKDAYAAAKGMTYMGRTGYLATVTSKNEDTYLNSLSDGQTGWLGGTILAYTGSKVNASGGTGGILLYYSDFSTSSFASGGWYWACGPEIGNVFYNKTTLKDLSVTDIDNENTELGYYFNWGRGDEPNNTDGGENCLTTLVLSIEGKQKTAFSWNDIDNDYLNDPTYSAKGYFVEYGDKGASDGWGDSGIGDDSAFATVSGTLIDPTEITLTTLSRTSVSTYTCDIDLPVSAKMVTISVDSGYFTVPADGGVLTFLGGTYGTNYISAFTSSTNYDSAVFSFDDPSAAADLLDDIIYTQGSATTQKITATSSAVSPETGDLYFEGHFYRYVSGNINWPTAVINAGATADTYFGGRGYIATATSQSENSILLRLTDTGTADADHWNDAYMGGLWQRNTGTVAAPNITRDNADPKITYDNIVDAVSGGTLTSLLPDYSAKYNDFVESNISTYIKSKLKYYWIDGPEAGDEIEYNVTGGFSPWHSGEPNSGDFVYIGCQGAYWDDQSADINLGAYATLSGYIVEFSGYDGGSDAGIIKSAEKTVNAAYAITYNLDGGTNPDNAPASYVYGTGATLPTPTKAGFAFGGWYTDAGFTGSAVPAIGTADTGAKEYFAKWSAIPVSSSEGAPVIVNGTEYTAGTAQDSTANGKTVTTVTVETDKLQKVLDSQGDNPSVIIPVSSGSDVSRGVLTGQMVSDMEERDATLSVRTNTVTYTLPAQEIDIDAVSEQFGTDVTLADITVNIEIAEPSDSTVTVVESAAENGGFEIMIPAVDFNITCSYNGQTVDATVFNVYVQRTIAIPDGVDPDKITTGVVVKPDGTSYHVPTQVTVINGKYYAVINSLTNSTYTVVWNPVEFTDVANHWSKDAVNDMGSRMVVTGVGNGLYEPDRDITRAEFAAIVVRALGLDKGMGENSFTDVASTDWFAGYIETAVGYGIIEGYGDKTFGPNDLITREQAMTMLSRAMKTTASAPTLTDTEVAALLAGYSDSEQTSDYARVGAADCLKTGVILGRSTGVLAPKDYITRAEVATSIQRLLKDADLI